MLLEQSFNTNVLVSLDWKQWANCPTRLFQRPENREMKHSDVLQTIRCLRSAIEIPRGSVTEVNPGRSNCTPRGNDHLRQREARSSLDGTSDLFF